MAVMDKLKMFVVQEPIVAASCLIGGVGSLSLDQLLKTVLQKETPVQMDSSEVKLTNHEDDSTLHNSITSSCELLDTSIEVATNNTNSIASRRHLVISLMREVELKEKATEKAKEEAAKSGLDIFAKVDELKQAQQLAKETNDMHAKEVYAKNASLANELKELERRVSDVVNEGGKFLRVFDEMQRALEMRLTSAISEKELADKEKIEKESLAKEALAFEESQMSKLVEESKKLKETAMKNSKLEEFLTDRGHVVDKLHESVSVKCNDMNLLKEFLHKPACHQNEISSSIQQSSKDTVEPTAIPKESTDEHVQIVKELLKIPDTNLEGNNKGSFEVKSAPKMSRYSFARDVQIRVCGTPFNLNMDFLAARSSKLCKLFKENPDENLSCVLPDIPTTPEIFEIMARFCYGFQVNFTPENVIQISCLACYLGMTETHSPQNLLKQAQSFFENKIITGWNESLTSLKAVENTPIILQQALHLGLIDDCMDSIIAKALDNPLLLGEPIKNTIDDDDDDDYDYDYVVDDDDDDDDVDEEEGKNLSVTTLHLQFYEPIIRGMMIQCKVGSNYIASNLYQYAKRWVFLDPQETDEESSSEGDSRRLAIEAIERLLPYDRGVLPCALLSEMLIFAKVLEANVNCRDGFELRIGRQLDLAAVNDLLIPSQACSIEEKYDTECVRRILKHFCQNFTGKDQSGLDFVADLAEDFLSMVANDIDLRKDRFISLAEMSIAASEGSPRTSDGIYRAIDIYLDKHEILTESEREEICGVLECNKLSPRACEHVARNERLPARVVVQVSSKQVEKDSGFKSTVFL